MLLFRPQMRKHFVALYLHLKVLHWAEDKNEMYLLRVNVG